MTMRSAMGLTALEEYPPGVRVAFDASVPDAACRG